ncbi:MAG TPA: class I SAM-dependent methyltransferase [Gaiellaceae bacterium]|nr:class I SAM-dependent methyltransferase [Gaiellaceae bacterium]
MVVDPDGVELETILGLVDLRDRQVVEVGCGDGRLSFACAQAGAHVFGFDPDEDAIEVARAGTPRSLRKRVSFEVADAAEIDLPSRKFDLALFSWSL